MLCDGKIHSVYFNDGEKKCMLFENDTLRWRTHAQSLPNMQQSWNLKRQKSSLVYFFIRSFFLSCATGSPRNRIESYFYECMSKFRSLSVCACSYISGCAHCIVCYTCCTSIWHVWIVHCQCTNLNLEIQTYGENDASHALNNIAQRCDNKRKKNRPS